ncbi:MAG TPA: MBL fold metallo-hydrolase [Thermoanaerobaculia bacterium]|nr:MBL fold metallo-hydrolase [Thermoanaerobaculia bacterium]
MKRSAALFWFAVLCLLQPGRPAGAGEPYRAISLQPGLPDFGPARRLPIQEPRRAAIPEAPGAQAVELVCGKKKEADYACWLLLPQKEKGVAIVTLPLRQEESGVLSVSINLHLERGSDAKTPLELRLLPAYNILLYQWSETIAARVVRGEALPDFAVTALDGKGWRISQLKGSVVVLSSWATWCVPCVEELPDLNRLAEKYAGAPVRFLAVASDTAEQVDGFLQQRPFRFEQSLATEESKRILGEGVPRHLVLDADGKVVEDLGGASASVTQQLESVLQSLVAWAPAASPGARVVALGTVQDGGMPQTGCDCSRCAAARKSPALRRHVASLLLRAGGRDYLVDATPDLPAQIERIHRTRRHPAGKVDRAPVDGVLLTHAHIGHYLGLAHFGFESLNTKDIPVYVTPRMAEYLRTSGPWSQLVKLGNIALREVRPGTPFELDGGLTVTPLQVPHRDEYSDTMAFVIRGPKKALLYVPDTDSWREWARPLPEVLEAEKIDFALLDATFYSPDELPDRDVTKIKHPLITDSMDLLEPLVKAGKVRVWFTHLNHSNPALDVNSSARRVIERRGFRVLAEGEEIEL